MELMVVRLSVAHVDISGLAILASLKADAMLETFETSQPGPLSPGSVADAAPSKEDVMSSTEVVFQLPSNGSTELAPWNEFRREVTKSVIQPAPFRPVPTKEAAFWNVLARLVTLLVVHVDRSGLAELARWKAFSSVVTLLVSHPGPLTPTASQEEAPAQVFSSVVTMEVCQVDRFIFARAAP
jgi:hypothetical protein